jgi:hypothetical protein
MGSSGEVGQCELRIAMVRIARVYAPRIGRNGVGGSGSAHFVVYGRSRGGGGWHCFLGETASVVSARRCGETVV